MVGQFIESQLNSYCSFLKSYGKFKMYFTCASYKDLSFLITDEIPREWPN